jgi:hypothetical protein
MAMRALVVLWFGMSCANGSLDEERAVLTRLAGQPDASQKAILLHLKTFLPSTRWTFSDIQLFVDRITAGFQVPVWFH